ncbi:MAG: hypothetical protein HZB29_08360 [Nitrospinae bacterium]|nr:hypothetical protein [Nitrospinota bacterium]
MERLQKVMSKTAACLAAAALATSCAYSKDPDFQADLKPSTILKEEQFGGPNQWPPYAEVYTQRFVWKMKHLALQLRDKSRAAGRGDLVALMTTIVPVDNIYKPTSFGRICSEQLMTEMDKSGMKMIEARKTGDYFIKDNQGEFALSRDLKKIAAQASADAVMVGTFAKSRDQILINVRLVDLKNSSVIAGASTMMDVRGDKFLSSILADDEKGDGSQAASTIQIRKKVSAEMDPYAEVLQGMIRTMAEKAAETNPPESLGRKTVAVTTFVDINHMYRSSQFGKFMSEQLMTELSTLGYNVIELRATPEIYVDVRAGEMGLSREMSQLMANRGAEAVIVGTYTRAGDTVVVNGRFLNARSHTVTGVGELIVDAGPRNKFIAGLLEKEVTAVPPAETVEGF